MQTLPIVITLSHLTASQIPNQKTGKQKTDISRKQQRSEQANITQEKLSCEMLHKKLGLPGQFS